MSTKIYSGYILKNMSLLELDAFFKDFAKKAERLAGTMVAKFFAEEIIEMIDEFPFIDEESFVRRHVLLRKEMDKFMEQSKYEKMGAVIKEEEKVKLSLSAYPHRVPLASVYRKAQERYNRIQQTNERDPEVDFDVSVTLIPIRTKRGTKILCYFGSEQTELENLWAINEEVTYYGYWNNTNPPDDITEKQWEKRREEWDIAIPGFRIESPMKVDVIKGFPSLGYIPYKEVLKHIPPLWKRAKRVAFDRILDKKFQELKKLVLDKDDFDENWKYFNQARKFLRTPEGKMLLRKEAARINHLLLPQIEKKHLFEHYSRISKSYEQKRKRSKGRVVERRGTARKACQKRSRMRSMRKR